MLPWQILYGNFVRNIYEMGGRTWIRKKSLVDPELGRE